MPRVTIGPVYAVSGFSGRRFGRTRVGGYLPLRSSAWKRIHELNMPVWELHGVARTAGRLPWQESFALAGIFWRLASLAANTELPGRLVYRDDELLRPYSDAQIAELLHMTLGEWRAQVAPRLLPGTGVGALEMLGLVEIDVDEPHRGAAADPRQGRLDFFCGPAREATHHARPTNETSRYEQDGTERAAPGPTADPAGSGPRSVAFLREEQEEQEDEQAAPTAAARGAAAGTPHGGDASHGEAAGPTDGPGTATALREDALYWAERGDQARAQAGAIACLRRLLRGERHKQDARDWGAALTRLWHSAPGHGAHLDGQHRRQRLAALLLKAEEVGGDPGNERPAAVFSAWLAGAGLRQARRRT